MRVLVSFVFPWVGLLVLAVPTAVAGTGEPMAMFASDTVLEVTISGPLKQLNSDRDREKTYGPSTLTYRDAAGELVSLDIELQTRGQKRLRYRTCKFPPIRILAGKESRSGTLFEGKKKWKLVTQCNNYIKKYESYLITEFLAYKILNLLTDNSYLVRLANITYVDIPSDETYASSFGFFLEPTKALAKRIGRKRIKVTETSAIYLEGEHLNLVSLYQMMLGNTDWSATHGGNEECCHNGKLFGEVDGAENLFIPYDFDMTGLVNPRYATVDIALKLKSIRDRRYRGYCRNLDMLDANIALLNSKQARIISLFDDTPYLSEGEKDKKTNYLNKFFKLVNDPDRVKRKIYGRCHKSYMVDADDVT